MKIESCALCAKRQHMRVMVADGERLLCRACAFQKATRTVRAIHTLTPLAAAVMSARP